MNYMHAVEKVCAGMMLAIVVPMLTCDLALGQTACVRPPAGLTGWWPGDGDPKDIVKTNHGTLQGGTQFAAGKVGKAFSFDGIDDSVIIQDSPELNPARAITVDAWVYLAWSEGSAMDIVSKDGENFDRQYLLDVYWGSPGSQNFAAHVSTPDCLGPWNLCYFSGNTPVALQTWFHVAMTYDGSKLRLYVNGQPDGEMVVTGEIIRTPQPVRIGGGAPPGYMQLYFPGLIDEVEIFDRALSAAEIASIYLAGGAGKCKSLEVQIDIKPGSFPNAINLGSGGTVPVAILSTSAFDARTVDPMSVTLAGAATALRGKGTPMASFEDVNKDGLLDLVVHVTTEALQLTQGDSEAVLEGMTFDGKRIRGADLVRIVP